MAMNALLKEIRHNPLLWLLVVPLVFAAAKLRPEAPSRRNWKRCDIGCSNCLHRLPVRG
jgi:hypothetical protein